MCEETWRTGLNLVLVDSQFQWSLFMCLESKKNMEILQDQQQGLFYSKLQFYITAVLYKKFSHNM